MLHRHSHSWAAAAPVLIVLTALGSPLAAQPVAVSPGSSTGGVISDGCPTFSWGHMPGATAYELVVYSAEDDRDSAPPVLTERIHGSASSWTPTLARCLERGKRYAWSVRAVGAAAASTWSAPQLFEVAATPSEVEFEKALAVVQKYLTENKALSNDTVGADNTSQPTSAPSEMPSFRAGSDNLLPAASISTDGTVEALGFSGPGGGPLVTESIVGTGPSGLQFLNVITGYPGSLQIASSVSGVYGSPLQVVSLSGTAYAPLPIVSPIQLQQLVLGPPDGSPIQVLNEINPVAGITGFSPGAHTADTTCDGQPCDGTDFSNVDAISLGGTPAASFAAGPHTPALSSLQIAQGVCDACFLASNSGCSSLCDISSPNSSTSSVRTCFGNVFDSGGSSGTYTNSESGSLQLCAAGGLPILKLVFEAFHTETNFDRLWLFDGAGEPTLGANCNVDPTPAAGQVLLTPGGLTGVLSTPPIFTSGPSDCLTLQFCSDASVTRPGWAARVSCP